MELRQLEHFLAVAEEGSFTAAAARVYMVQSSLSASLLALERELGADLFIRGRHGAELTDAGQALLEPARASLADARRARDAVAAVKDAMRGTVRIAYTAAPRMLDVAETLLRFKRDHPEVRVEARPAAAREVANLVLDGRVDYAVAARIDRPGLHFEPLFSSPLVLICPRGNRLGGAAEVDMRDVLAESIVDLPRGWRTRELFDRMVADRGLTRKVTLEIQDWLSVLTLVQRGTGVTYGAEASVDAGIFDGVAIAGLAGAPEWEFGVLYRDENLRGAAGRAYLSAYLSQVRRSET